MEGLASSQRPVILRSPLVTIGMVTFNSESYIEAALESALAQTWSNIEIVVCDDASTDATWERISAYGDRRIRTYKNDRNLGEYPNRNRVLSLARGDYLLFLDGDDLLYPHGIEFLLTMLHGFPAAGMAMARPWSEQFVYPYELTPREFYLAQYLGPDILGINFTQILFRTDALRGVGGLSEKFRTGDAWIQYRIGLEWNCLLVSDGVAWWRRRPDQASEIVLTDRINVLEALIFRREFLRNPLCPLNSSERALALDNLIRAFLRVVVRTALAGRPRLALSLLRRGQVGPRSWSAVLRRPVSTHLSGVTATAPLRLPLNKNPMAAKCDGNA